MEAGSGMGMDSIIIRRDSVGTQTSRIIHRGVTGTTIRHEMCRSFWASVRRSELTGDIPVTTLGPPITRGIGHLGIARAITDTAAWATAALVMEAWVWDTVTVEDIRRSAISRSATTTTRITCQRLTQPA